MTLMVGNLIGTPTQIGTPICPHLALLTAHQKRPQRGRSRIAGQTYTPTTLASEAADRLSVVPVVVVGRVDVARVEVEVVRVVARVGRRGPIVAVVAGVVQRAGVDITSARRRDRPDNRPAERDSAADQKHRSENEIHFDWPSTVALDSFPCLCFLSL